MYFSDKRCLFPALTENVSCDVLVVGGGIAGFLCAFKLCKIGFNVTVVEKNIIASGKTAYNMGVLFSQGSPSYRDIGFQNVDNVEKSSGGYSESFERIQNISETVGDPSYNKVKALFYTENPSRKVFSEMRNEYQRRFFSGEKCAFLTWREALKMYSFNISSGIISDSVAQYNPIVFCEKIADHVSLFGGTVCENTEIVSIDKTADNRGFVSVTSRGSVVNSRAVIDCRGIIKEDAYSFSSYYFVSKPIKEFVGWYCGSVISDDCRNRLYLRTDGSDRVVASIHSHSLLRQIGSIYDSCMYNYGEKLLRSMFFGIKDLEFDHVGKYDFRLPKRNSVESLWENSNEGLFRLNCNDTVGCLNSEILAEKVVRSVVKLLSANP